MVVFLCLCCMCCGNSLWAFWQSVSSRREPIYRAHISVYTHEMWNENACTMTNICVSDDVKIYIR